MKKFNKEIEVKVSVDAIAEKLLSVMDKDFKHAELVTETIIGTSLEKGIATMGMLYNALSGYTNEINFKIGDIVSSEEDTHTTYEEVEPNSWKNKSVPTTNAKVVSINLYAERKLEIEYEVRDYSGKPVTKKEWVRHTYYSIVGDNS